MEEKISVDLGNVQKTLFLPLWGRAYESKKTHPMLVDKTAVEIIHKVDFDFDTIARNVNKLSRVAWIMRSIKLDETIAGFLKKHPRGTIVNIGCGLDTTFDRVDNGLLTWYELDLPDVIELRKKFIPASERRQYIIASCLEESWMDQIVVTDNVFFIAAGVLYYFEEEQVKTLFKRIADHFPGAEIFFDASSPNGVKAANRQVIKSAGLDERSFLKWGLNDVMDILNWDKRYRLIKKMSYFKDRRLSLHIRLVGLISDLMKIQYMVHLQL